MPIPFTCPHCGQKTIVDDKYAGQSGPCLQCGMAVHVPLANEPGAIVPDQKAEFPTGASAAIALGCGCVVVLVALFVLFGGIVGPFFF